MSEISMTYFKAETGKAFDAVSRFLDCHAAALAELDAFAKEMKSTGNFLREGAHVVGLQFMPERRPEGWRQVGNKAHLFYAPSKAVPEIQSRMAALRIPTNEGLAHELGLPPFFMTPHGHYCAAATGFMVGGVAYGTCPASLKSALVAKNPGLTCIMRGEYFVALDKCEGYKP